MSQHENLMTFEDGTVNTFVMCGVFKFQEVIFEDAVDVFFPQSSRFRMTVQSMWDREHKGSVNFLSKFIFVPICMGVVHLHECRSFGWW